MLRAVLLLFAAGSFDDSFRNGLTALQRGDLASAQSELEAASKMTPRDGRVWVALSQTYWRLHKNTEAEDAAGTFGERVADLEADTVVDLICFEPDSASQLVEALPCVSA